MLSTCPVGQAAAVTASGTSSSLAAREAEAVLAVPAAAEDTFGSVRAMTAFEGLT